MKKFLVVTAITNSKDVLIDPPVVFDNCDYVAYVDRKYDVKVWEQRDVLKFSGIDNFSNRRDAKPYKIMSALMFPQYEYIIWEDGNHQLKKNPQDIIDEYGDMCDFLLFKHPDRTCLFQELDACYNWNLDHKEHLEIQKKFYKHLGMPSDFGLFELSTFIVKTTEAAKQLQLIWWEQICRFSSRDQISFPYCLWRMGGKIKKRKLRGYSNLVSMGGVNEGNEYFQDQGKHANY
jgi:hypothetical protein